MIDGKFDVVFRGQIVKSFELDDVKANIVKLFKSSPEAVERLFSGDEVTIRKGLDYTAAMKYQSALKSSGALALIKEITEEAKETLVEQEEPVEAVVSKTVSSNSETKEPVETSNSAGEATSIESDDSLSIAAVGARLLPDKVYEKRDVDTSELSLASAGERILPKQEPKDYPQPSIDHLSLDD